MLPKSRTDDKKRIFPILFPVLQAIYILFKLIASLFIIIKLSPAGTGRRQKNRVSRLSLRGTDFYRLLQGISQNGVRESAGFCRLLNLFSGLSDQHQATHLSVKGINPFGVLRLLVIS